MKGETLFDYNSIGDALCQPEIVVDSPESMAAVPAGRRVDVSALFGEEPGELSKQRLAAADYAAILAASLPSSDELDGGDPWRTPAGKSIDAMAHCGKRRIAARVRADASAPQFAHISGRYCKGPVCPICAARRAHNSQAKHLAALSYIQGERLSAHQKPFQAVYMVLSFENQSPRAVPAARLVLSLALKYFCDVTQNKKYAVVVRDSIRTIESTLNTDVSSSGVLSPWFGTLNIHANILALVPQSYFTSRNYVKQSELAEDWRNCIIRACRYYQTHKADISGVWTDLLFRHTPEYDKAPNGCFQPFDPARYLGPSGEAIVHIERVRDRKNRKSMDITAGVVETVKYCLKSDDLQKLRSASAAAGLPDDLALQVLLGYCCLFYDLRRCTSRGLWRSAFKALCLAADSEDVGAESLELDPHKAQVIGLFWASNPETAGYILGGQYIGRDAVTVLSAYLTGDVLALLHGLSSPDELVSRASALGLPDLSDVEISVKDFRKGYARNHPNRTGRKSAQRVELSKQRLAVLDDPMAEAVELPFTPDDADIFPDGVQTSLFD